MEGVTFELGSGPRSPGQVDAFAADLARQVAGLRDQLHSRVRESIEAMVGEAQAQDWKRTRVATMLRLSEEAWYRVDADLGRLHSHLEQVPDAYRNACPPEAW